MATTNALPFNLLRLASAAVLAASALAAGARAQSGRTAPPPTPTPTPTEQQQQAAPRFVPAPGEDRYRLVYAPGWDGALDPDGEDADDARHSRMNNFVARLNEAGARGYRLLTAVNGWQPVAVVELGEAQYEYGWFETAVVGRAGADDRRIYTRFNGFYAKQAAGGFRLAAHFVTERRCALFSTGFFHVEERCIFRDLYLMERRKGDERPRQIRVAVSNPEGRSGRPGDELTALVREGLAEGLRPAHAFSKFALLLEGADGRGAASDGAAGFRVVTLSPSGRGDIEKMVNELAQQGYRMRLNNNGVVVMSRAAGGAAPAEYLWLDAKEKSFARRLAEAQEAGAVYRMTYPDGRFEKTRLVFERAGDGRRRDYRVFHVELHYAENVAQKKVITDITPRTRETLKEVEGLLRDGYVVRDLFWAEGAQLLLERAR